MLQSSPAITPPGTLQGKTMKHLMTVLALSLAALSTSAFATTHKEAPDMAKGASAPMGKQQSKMGDCNKDAGEKKGDERKAFMKTCLSAKPAPTQQNKMKSCNADPKAKATKGDERKAFMKECLSK
jgi:psiF repeat